jgi:CDP-diacylglycerol--glycerol-3-phosphate 3-phosphatidyltransferase
MNIFQDSGMKVNLKHIILIPNLISLFRLCLALPTIVIFINYDALASPNYYIVGLILIAFISDLADGYFARKTGQISELGKFLDPLADKILTLTIVFFLWWINSVPSVYLAILLLRDFIIFTGGVYLARRTDFITPSNMFGKITVLTIGLFFLAILLSGKDSAYSQFFMYFSASMSIMSVIVYTFRAVGIIRKYGNTK